MIERHTQILFGNWTEVMHNVRGSLDNIKRNMQYAVLKQLDFRAIEDREYLIDRFLIVWSGSTLHRWYLFKSIIRI